MIELSEVWQHYGVRPVLRGVNLKIERGELVALMGPNGMGKSTLMRVMAGALMPQKGWAAIDGVKRRSGIEEELAIRRKVAYLQDEPWLPLMHAGREFLLSVGRLYEVEDYRLFDHVDRLLELFHLESKADAPIATYSHGQKKKIALCSALVSEAQVLLMDEPFSGGLDPSGLLALKLVLKKLTESGDRTIVLATQVPELVEGLASRIAILREGEILAYGSLEEIRAKAGVEGPLDAVLEKLISPHTMDRIARYFEK